MAMQSVSDLEASSEIQDVRARVSGFLQDFIYPNEPALLKHDEEAGRVMRSIQAKAKEHGLWALGLPKEIGGGGLGFMPYVFVNEIVGRSEFALAGWERIPRRMRPCFTFTAAPNRKSAG